MTPANPAPVLTEARVADWGARALASTPGALLPLFTKSSGQVWIPGSDGSRERALWQNAPFACRYLANLKTCDRLLIMLIRRSAFDLVSGRLSYADAVAILGPRQVGKTTLARAIADEMEHGAIYLDLESEEDRAKLTQAEAFFAQHSEKLIVLDEVQRAPEIFEVLRGQIDARRRIGERGGKFLILGSASMDLLRQSSESLAGRVSYVFMNPLAADEAISHSMMDDVASVDFISQPAASNQLAESGRPEPLRVCRRPFGLSYAAIAGSSSVA